MAALPAKASGYSGITMVVRNQIRYVTLNAFKFAVKVLSKTIFLRLYVASSNYRNSELRWSLTIAIACSEICSKEVIASFIVTFMPNMMQLNPEFQPVVNA
ncbi:MAG: hypothetical protein Q8N35_13885 [Methylococcaceae bacterium]|jgi:hypothetical protein|nr:hypothetical protein [Methylococcaceae bacterium]MDP3020671.1 hypothetical protein [Methylococcaceae bacterium]